MSHPTQVAPRLPGATTPLSVIVTAEHGGNDVPPEYSELFRDAAQLLESHRGWDPGSLDLARRLAARLDTPLVTATVSRLLVDLNRSPHHRDVFSEVTRRLDRSERNVLLEKWHRPHRDQVMEAVAADVGRGRPVLHLGIHSFTPELNGIVRKPDIAFLYDPQRPTEARIARAWAKSCAASLPQRVVRRNDPYRGAADGLTRSLRQRHPDAQYAGIEVEVNQRHVTSAGSFPDWVSDVLVQTLKAVLAFSTTRPHRPA